jgi:hypothetical protein
LIEASVWIMSRIVTPPAPGMLLPRALTMPLVTVWSNPKGLPMAMTFCPTWRSRDVPIVTGVMSETFSASLRTAMSLFGSRPTSLASTCFWFGRLTMNLSPSAMTWKLVTTCPWSSQTKPEPLPCGTGWSDE